MTTTDTEHPGQHFDHVVGNWVDDVEHDASGAVHDAEHVVSAIDDDPDVKAAMALLESAREAAEKKAAEAQTSSEPTTAPEGVAEWITSHFDDIEKWADEIEARIAALESGKGESSSPKTSPSSGASSGS